MELYRAVSDRPNDPAAAISEASEGAAPRRRPLAALLVQNDQLPADVRRVELASDRKDAGLVRSEFHVLRLAARDHCFNVEGGDLVSVLIWIRLHVVDELDLHFVALVHDQGGRHPDLRALVLDVR